MLSNIDKKTFTYILYDGNQNFEKFAHLKEIIHNNSILLQTPEFYSLPYKLRINHEIKVIKEIIRLFKSKILNISHISYFQHFFQNSYVFENHFGIFRKTIEMFGSETQIERILKEIDDLNILGSVVLSEINLYNNQRILDIKDITTKAIYCKKAKKFIIENDVSNSKFCEYFSYFSTHIIVYARIFAEERCYGIYPFLIELRDSDFKLKQNIEIKWLGKIIGERTNRQFLINFNKLELNLDSLICEHNFLENNNTWNQNFYIQKYKPIHLIQSFNDCEKNVFDLFKCVFLVTKYNNFRTQFTTLEKSKDERKIIDYQNNFVKIINGLIEGTVNRIALNVLQNNKGTIFGNLSKNSQKVENLTIFIDGIKAYLFKKNLSLIQNMRENCGGYGYLQYSGIPQIQENAILSATSLSDSDDNLCDLALLFLKKLNNNEDNGKKFKTFYFPYLHEPENLQKGFIEIENMERNFDNFIYLGKVVNLKASLISSKMIEKFKSLDELNSKLTIKNDPLMLEIIVKFAETLINYYFSFQNINFLIYAIYRPLNKILIPFLKNFIFNNLLDDLIILKEIYPNDNIVDIVNLIITFREKNYEEIRIHLYDIVDSFEFDEKSLNCLVEGDRDRFYETLYDLMKNKNLRNDKETIEQIVSPLRDFLNRSSL